MGIKGLIIALIIGILSGCASRAAIPVSFYYPKKIPDLEIIKTSIETRNKTIERHPQWRMIASQRILLKSLEDIPQSDYKRFRDYLDDGVMYIIVHPAYYFFFHEDPALSSDVKEINTFIERYAYTRTDLFLREQERALRDFLEITSTRNRLILLVLPGNYREYMGYKYRYGEDEFARYINEVSNDSKATLYLYSEKPNRGMLSRESKDILLSFIKTVNPDRIILGGGYLGRCLEDFYRQLSPLMKDGQVEIEPWISALSPEDLKYFDLDDLVKDGRLDMSLMKDLQKNYSSAKNNSFRELIKNYRNNKGKGG
ncbi:MAG: hypothetical protein ACK415_08560 [Thermodesulfovibrionales bacterium]